MTFIPKGPISRRELIRRTGQLGMMGAAAPLALQLNGLANAAAAGATDYKALVCIFLYGGNDFGNTVIPVDLANYDKYHAIRGGSDGRQAGGIAYGHDEILPMALKPVAQQTLTDDIQYALNPNLKGMKSLFDHGHAAIQLNVGPLITPLTLAQYNNPNKTAYPLPPKLFSHNDQQSVWQSLGSEGSTVGWGGRLGDMVLDGNDESLLTCISASGNAVFVSGNDALQYQISPDGAIAIGAINNPAVPESIRDAMKYLITRPSDHMLENEFAKVTQRSIRMEGIVNGALNRVQMNTPFDTSPGDNELADQMKIIARLIGARKAFGAKRQVFFASLGGFDNHDLLMENHPALLAKIDEAMSSFYAATVELGVADQVTAFTASDFGRAFGRNADGSDHGWGGHHFVVGGAVKGGQYYGTAPHVSLETEDQVGQGRLLPSTGVDQFAATLARWFGASASDLPDIFPNIGNFSDTDLKFI
ncbi:DUF1501 domain-containing protein [Parvularcula sp. LCG005]|uniref:DUF1501 domain-containing protein n=1 Tax=Parvularcula sp. LCG005 TaxID=3078805 RepID=UPI0029428777|nr:DUF1501 domain-containing protein [Parvularcula sp. LCG005]WOI52774.1 DUF1501 domain-containing protein [Parvularcula sp. LCG005]